MEETKRKINWETVVVIILAAFSAIRRALQVNLSILYNAKGFL